MTDFEQFCSALEVKITNSYLEGVPSEEAEKLAGEFLTAQMVVSRELKKYDLDSRTRKSGVKAIRAAIYLDILQKNEKKPTEAAIAAMIDSDEIVVNEQRALDLAEVERDNIDRYFNVFGNAHIHFRSLAKGSFGN